MEGWLEKKGGGSSTFGRRNWKVRWFILEGTKITYYENFDRASGFPSNPKGEYDVLGCDADVAFHKDKKFVFALLHPGRKPFYMNAEGERLRTAWIKAIKNAASGKKPGTDYTEYFDVFGLTPATAPALSDVSRVYRRMALKAHPDKGGDPLEFKKIQEAFSMLQQKYDDEQELAEMKEMRFSCTIKKGGKGIGLGMVVVENQTTGFIVIKTVLPTMNVTYIDASAGGSLESGDRLVKVGSNDTSKWPLLRLVERLGDFRCPVNQEVQMEFVRLVPKDPSRRSTRVASQTSGTFAQSQPTSSAAYSEPEVSESTAPNGVQFADSTRKGSNDSRVSFKDKSEERGSYDQAEFAPKTRLSVSIPKREDQAGDRRSRVSVRGNLAELKKDLDMERKSMKLEAEKIASGAQDRGAGGDRGDEGVSGEPASPDSRAGFGFFRPKSMRSPTVVERTPGDRTSADVGSPRQSDYDGQSPRHAATSPRRQTLRDPQRDANVAVQAHMHSILEIEKLKEANKKETDDLSGRIHNLMKENQTLKDSVKRCLMAVDNSKKREDLLRIQVQQLMLVSEVSTDQLSQTLRDTMEVSMLVKSGMLKTLSRPGKSDDSIEAQEGLTQMFGPQKQAMRDAMVAVAACDASGQMLNRWKLTGEPASVKLKKLEQRLLPLCMEENYTHAFVPIMETHRDSVRASLDSGRVNTHQIFDDSVDDSDPTAQSAYAPNTYAESIPMMWDDGDRAFDRDSLFSSTPPPMKMATEDIPGQQMGNIPQEGLKPSRSVSPRLQPPPLRARAAPSPKGAQGRRLSAGHTARMNPYDSPTNLANTKKTTLSDDFKPFSSQVSDISANSQPNVGHVKSQHKEFDTWQTSQDAFYAKINSASGPFEATGDMSLANLSPITNSNTKPPTGRKKSYMDSTATARAQGRR